MADILMHCPRYLSLAILAIFLILGYGCLDIFDNSGNLTTNNTTHPMSCDSRCAQNYPHSIGNTTNNSCTCNCVKGYMWFNSSCITSQEYTELMPVICDSLCIKNSPHSKGRPRGMNCTCGCEEGYFSYNKTCITKTEFEALSPVLCTTDHPVLKYYSWDYKDISTYIYLCYNKQAVYTDPGRSTREDYWNFVNDPRSNASVYLVTHLLTNISGNEGLSKYEQVEFAIAFVQSLPYTYDNVSTPYDNYPRFPSETIYADGGDCEDTAILMAAILKKMGYGVSLLRMPHHVATGVECDPSDFNYTVASYAYGGRDYCYLETTGEHYRIGELPRDFSASDEVKVIPLLDSLQPDMYIDSSYRIVSAPSGSSYTRLNVTGIHFDNLGTATATGVMVSVALESTTEGKVWDRYTYSVGSMPAGYSYDYNVTGLTVPTGEAFRVLVTVYGDNFKTAESRGSWAVWK